MATWYLNPALTTMRAEVNAEYPNRDKASDGTIGDPAHQATDSDHNPDKDGTVDAWDMDVDLRVPNTAAEIARIKARFEAHPSSQYWIHNRRIASRDWGWARRYYSGPNPHDKHVHFNTRDSHQRSTKPWGIYQEDDVTKDDIKAAVLAALNEPVQLAGGHADRLKAAGWTTKRSMLDWIGYLAETALLADKARHELILKAISDDPDAPLVIDPEDLAAVADQLAARLAPAVADEQARRMVS